MLKKLVVFFSLFLSFTFYVYSQTKIPLGFLDIPWGADKATVQSKLIARGFTITESGQSIIWASGKWANNDAWLSVYMNNNSFTLAALEIPIDAAFFQEEFSSILFNLRLVYGSELFFDSAGFSAYWKFSNGSKISLRKIKREVENISISYSILPDYTPSLDY